MMNSFDQTIEHMAIDVEQDEGTCILFGVSDDTVLLQHAVDVLRKRLSPDITLRDFRYDPEHLSLLEGTVAVTASGEGRPAVSVTGLEALPRDKRTEAIYLLNLQRNRFGRTGIAVILWVNRATLAEISNWSADFYSWRSATFLLEPPPGWNTLESMHRSYLQALVAHNEFVNLQGLAPIRGGQIVQMRMGDIFVPLRAEQEVESSDVPSLLGLASAGATKLGSVGIAGEIEEVQQPANMLIDMRRRQERWAFEPRREVKTRPVQIPDLVQERRAVVLGDPGAGKTTLLRYVAYTLARSQIDNRHSDIINRTPDLAHCLPVYIRIGEYAQHLQQNPEETLDAFASLGCQVRQLPLSHELLKDAMMKGRVLFLFDGLDEIIDAGQRREIAQRIEKFALAQPQCRTLVASRIVGYREVQLGGEFSQFTISPFEDDEIRHFAENWYKALGVFESAEKLVEAIQDSPSIRRLASNPLLLTVIALIHWRGTKLPNHRVTLYRLAAETLVDQWMSYRRVTPEGWDVQETMQALLPAIAWHLHQTTSSGLIGQQELHDLLVKTLREHDVRLSENEAHCRASQFRRNVSEFSGIFLERGLDRNDRGIYGFLHLTFEEYFAALRLADRWQREGDTALKPLLHDPHWAEVILLAAGHFSEFSQYQATRFIRTILEAQSEYEDILHRDLLMAGRCLADDVRVDADLRKTILSRLLKVYQSSTSPLDLQEDIAVVLGSLAGTAVEKDILQELTKRLTGRKRQVCLAIIALGRLGTAAVTPEVLAILPKHFTDGSQDIRLAWIRALDGLGPAAATPEVLAALLKCLADADTEVSAMGVMALGKLGPAAATPGVLATLLRCLTDSNEKVRFVGITGFWELGPAAATPEVLATLLKYLTYADRGVSATGAIALGKLGPAAATPEVLATLLRYLTDTKWGVREVAAGTLGELGPAAGTPEVLAALLKCLGDANRSVRVEGGVALGRLWPGAATPEVLATLRKFLTDSNRDMRRAGAIALGQMGPRAATPEILAVLLKCLTDSDEDVRFEGTTALGRLGTAAATPEVLATLLKYLTDTHADVRRAGAETLAELGPAAATPEVMTALLKCLSDSDEGVRWAGAMALGRLGSTASIPGVLAALLKCITDADESVHEMAAESLKELSVFVRSQDRSKALKLLLPLTQSTNANHRNTGYVVLRNLLAAGPS